MSPARKRRIVSLLPSSHRDHLRVGAGGVAGRRHARMRSPRVRARLRPRSRAHIPPDASSREIDSLVRELQHAERSLYSLDAETVERPRPI